VQGDGTLHRLAETAKAREYRRRLFTEVGSGESRQKEHREFLTRPQDLPAVMTGPALVRGGQIEQLQGAVQRLLEALHPRG
jgi:hypothetical protein